MPVESFKRRFPDPSSMSDTAAVARVLPHMTVELKGLGSTSDGRVSVAFRDKQSAYYVGENSRIHEFLQEIERQPRALGKVWLKVELEGPRSSCPTNIVSASKVPPPPSPDEAFMALLEEHFPSY